MFKQIQENVTINKPVSSFGKKEKNRGRTENRIVEIYDDISGIDAKWIEIKRIIHVHRYGHRPEKKKNEGKYDEHHYYILSKAINDAEIVFWGIRGHWGIENKLHYVKDVVQNEDKSRIRKGKTIDNLSILKNIAINLFRMNGFHSITKANIYFANKIHKMINLIKKNKYEKYRTD